MVRIVRIIDSRTIVAGTTTVVLRGVEIPPAEERAAAEYLHRLLDGAWVYIENGDVYRSPDCLHVNAELQRHAWRSIHGMRYLGEFWPAGTPKPVARVPKVRRRSRS